jgi:hypothetical protein
MNQDYARFAMGAVIELLKQPNLTAEIDLVG